MKKPDSVIFQRNNDIHPFESQSSLEFLCRSNDCSLFAFGSHTKKRQHNLVWGRMFDAQVLDMFEFGIDESTFIPMMTFEVRSVLLYQFLVTRANANFCRVSSRQSHRSAEAIARLGSKPMFLFAGDEFEQKEEFKALKNFVTGAHFQARTLTALCV